MNKPCKNKMRRRILTVYVISALLLLLSLAASLSFGAVRLMPHELFCGLFCKDGYEIATTVIYHIRIPRVLAALISGIGLAISGVLLQSVTENPLAAPSIIGINSGAGLGVMIFLTVFPTSTAICGGFLLQLFAFFGAFLTTVIVILLAKRAGNGGASIILSGVAINALFNAVISLLSLINTDAIISYNIFSIGGFSGVGYASLIAPGVIVVTCAVVSIFLSGRINLLSLGADAASMLGVRVRALSFLLVIMASLCAASAVSIAGLIGFVGLVVPHVSRRLVGDSAARSIPLSIILGGILTTLADLFGRVLIPPTEIPVGITMAAVGVPFFIVLLLRGRGRYL